MNRAQLVPWTALHQQLGGSTRHVGAWKQEWLGRRRKKTRGTLPQVLEVYLAAKEAIAVADDGLILRRAEPPIPKWGRAQEMKRLLRTREEK